MGKRTGQIAGLAALGALGYLLSKDKKGQSSQSETRPSQSDTRVSAPSPAPKPTPAVERITPVPRMMDSGDDRDVGGGFNPAGLRRNTETGEMYDPGTVPTRAVASPANRSTVTPAALAPRAPAEVASAASSAASRPASAAPERTDANSNVPAAPERGSFRGPSAAQLREYESSIYPDESRRGRMASAQEGAAPRAASAPATAASRAAPAASKAASAPSRTASAAARPASAASQAAPEKKSGLTLGTPTRPAPGAPGIYAGKEAWAEYRKRQAEGMKKGGAVKKMASGGVTTSSASKRGDGIAQRGKTRGKLY